MKTNGMTIVLNGGKDVMESATIPVQWFFSEEVAQWAPTHLLIIDYTDSQFKNSYLYNGIRYLVKISDTIKFLQMFRPGIHHLCFMAFDIRAQNVKELEAYLLSKHDGLYDNSVCITSNIDGVGDDIDIGSRLTGQKICLIIKIEVPDVFFAKVPEKGFKRAIWNYVNGNLRHDERPIDQCANRKRFLWFLPLKFLFHGTFRACLGIFMTLYLIPSAIITFIAGWVPTRVFDVFVEFWNFNKHINSIYRPFTLCEEGGYFKYTYRVLWVRGSGRNITKIKTPLAPWALMFWGYNIYMIIHHRQSVSSWAVELPIMTTFMALLYFSLVVIFAVIAVYLFICIKERRISFITRFVKWFGELNLVENYKTKRNQAKIEKWNKAQSEERRKEEQLREQARLALQEHQDKYKTWLQTELSAKKAPERVDVHNLPRAFENDTIKRFKVSFWTLKAKVCKPYAR